MAASIAFQATDADNGTIGTGATYTFPLTVASAAGQERLVALAAIAAPFSLSPTFSACTIDGQTATRVGTTSHGADSGGACAFVTFFRAAGTSGTTINVVVTSSETCFSGYCALWTLNDADTVTATTNAATNDPTLNTNTTTGGCAAAAHLGFNSSGGSVAWSGLTEDFDSVNVFGNDIFSGASAAIVTGQTPRAISADLTPDASASAGSICVSFAPDAGGASAVPAMMHQYRMRRR